jgi:hypothetical protein
MSTDTAFALGMLAVARPGFPDRVRAFLLSVAVVDDLVSLVVLAFAYPAARGDLERASDLFRSFREQPTPELARSAGIGLAAALSPTTGSSGRGLCSTFTRLVYRAATAA